MIYISPPFGNYVSHKHCTRIRGTFTWEKRSGLLLQVVKTLRKTKGGWRNAIGFRNCGMENIQECDKDSVYSIAALNSDWAPFIENIPNRSKIEINLGCPNVSSYSIDDASLQKFAQRFPMTMVKVSPTVNVDFIERLRGCGIRTVHLSNTIPTDKGGISGAMLREVNLPLYRHIHGWFEHTGMAFVAGGGIYRPEHVRQYKEAGATSFSLSTVCFTPWRLNSIVNEAYGRK